MYEGKRRIKYFKINHILAVSSSIIYFYYILVFSLLSERYIYTFIHFIHFCTYRERQAKLNSCSTFLSEESKLNM